MLLNGLIKLHDSYVLINQSMSSVTRLNGGQSTLLVLSDLLGSGSIDPNSLRPMGVLGSLVTLTSPILVFS